MDVRAAQDKPDRGRVVSKSNMRAMKEVRGLDQAPQRWAGECVMAGSVKPYFVDKRAPAGVTTPFASNMTCTWRVVWRGWQDIHCSEARAVAGNCLKALFRMHHCIHEQILIWNEHSFSVSNMSVLQVQRCRACSHQPWANMHQAATPLHKQEAQ